MEEKDYIALGGVLGIGAIAAYLLTRKKAEELIDADIIQITVV